MGYRHSDGLAICFGVGRCPLLEGSCLWPGQLWRGRSGDLGCLLEPRQRGDPTTRGLEQPGACTAAAWEESWRAFLLGLWGTIACDIPG